MIKRVDLKDTENLLRSLNDLPNSFMFRGQASAAWRLESSLERLLGANWSAKNAQKYEEYALEQFQSKFHLYDRENVEPTSKLGWLSVLQHYGVPTRLIDFTLSPYVSLYFALEAAAAHATDDLALYALNYTAIMEASLAHIRAADANFQETRATLVRTQDVVFESLVDPGAFDVAWIGEPKFFNARLDRQGGTFLLSGNRANRIEDVLASTLYSQCDMYKFVVPGGLRESIFALLRKMNINSKSLYGDLNGLARSIRMELQIYS